MPNLKLNIKKNVFNAAYWPYRNAQQPTQIFYGGASGGKSIFISDRAVLDVAAGSRNYLICRNVGKSIKKSVFNEIEKSITKFKLNKIFKTNKTEMTITCTANQHQLVFTGLDDVEKIKSITPKKGVFTDIWLEEATETVYEAVQQLVRRMRGVAGVVKRLILSFNPIFKTHWIFKRWFSAIGWTDDQTIHESDDLLILKTTYIHNDFLDANDIKILEDEKDEYFHSVYTLGNWGTLGDVVLTNWTIEDFDESTFDIYNNGLDFGFSNDPTALTRTYYHKASKTLYICDDWEGRGDTNPQIAESIKPIVNEETVVCDSAEPKSVLELCGEGISAIGADKGKGSIDYGIQWLKQLIIKVKPKCQPTINNLQLYQWKKNKEGESLNVPVDRYNDFIDSIRYGNECNMTGRNDAEAVTVGQTQQVGDQW